MEMTEQPESEDKNKEADRMLLKQSTLGFVGNLLSDPLIRAKISGNEENLLAFITDSFLRAKNMKMSDWTENTKRQLAIFINCSVEQVG